MKGDNSNKRKNFVFDETHFELDYEQKELELEKEALYAEERIAGDLDFFAKNERKKKKMLNNTEKVATKKGCEGHRQRMYNKLLERGLNDFPEHEVLEMILFCAFSQGDTKPLARTLLKEFSSLKNVLNADPRDLMTVKGIKTASAAKIMLFKEVMNYIKANDKELTLSTEKEVGKYCIDHFGDKEVEHLYLLSFDGNNKLKSVNLISEGNETQTEANVKKIIRYANMLQAKKVILCHNHPIENVNPSSNDIILTNKISEILDVLNIELVDHIICTRTQYTSLAERNMIARNIGIDL